MITLPIYQSLNEIPYVKRFWIAYSGGLDSHVLLHALVEQGINNDYECHAVHIHHNLHAHADEWAEHCQQQAADLGITFHCIKVDATKLKGESQEAVSRAARYSALSDLMSTNDCLLTAHHQDDQAETLLLQLLRGSGIKGLAAMPTLSAFSQGFHARPLLDYSRKQLLNYATHHQLQWIEDSSNADESFDRNYLRHQVLPIIKQRWPSASKTISRVAQHAGQADQLLMQLARSDYAYVCADTANRLRIDRLWELTSAQQINVLRYWLHRLDLPIPSAIKLSHVISDVLSSRIDATPLVTWPGVEIRRYQNELFALLPLESHDASATIAWDLTQDLQLPTNLGVLTATQSQQGNLLLPDNTDITVRFRQGGENIQLVGKQHRQSLKKLMQTWQIPTWQRDRIPLIYHKENLVCVAGWAIDAAYYCNDDKHAWDVRVKTAIAKLA